MKHSENVLPMNYPEVTSYPFHSNLYSVLSNYPESFPWFYNFYIQLEAPRNFDRGLRLDYYTTFLWKSCPWLYYQRISRELVEKKWGTIKDFIIDSIDLGQYVYFIINTYNVTIYGNLKHKDWIHDIFIYGYNLEEGCFHAADNFKNGKYSFEKIPFEELEQAYQNFKHTGVTDWMSGIELISYKRGKRDDFHDVSLEFQFDKELMTIFFEEYLNGINTLKRYKIPTEQWKSNLFIYGMNIYNHLIKYLEAQKTSNIYRDLRPFHLLYEHKKIMVKRLEFLEKEGYTKDLLCEVKLYSELEEKTLTIRNLYLKYLVINSNDILDKIIIILSEIEKKERIVIKQILQKLKNQNEMNEE